MSRTNVPSDSTKSVQVKLSPETEKLLKHFKDASLPIIVDSVFISKAIKGDSLGINDVKTLSHGWITMDSLEMSSNNGFEDFYKIDSIKATGTYSKWAEKLDIGMTRLSNAYALQKIKYDDSTTLLLWALNYSNQEADPVFEITNVYCSLLKNNKVNTCFPLSIYSESADPPSSGQTLITGRLNKDGALIFNETDLTEDMDEMKGELTKIHYEYALADGKIKLKSKKITSHIQGVPVKE